MTLEAGTMAVVGRNGMGKTTLCHAIMGLTPIREGDIRLFGKSIRATSADQIVKRGVGYVPQGRRIWPSLSVDEHLRLAARKSAGGWTPARIFEIFPRLAERRRHGGAQLSGGEQQMLAISRALLAQPRLLVMDEPTEGLAPVIVEQVVHLLKELSKDSQIAVLLVEQNLGVATDVAEQVAVMVNGRIARVLPAATLAADQHLQQQLLGVAVGGTEPSPDQPEQAPPVAADSETEPEAEAVVGALAPTLWSGAGLPAGKAPAQTAPTPVRAESQSTMIQVSVADAVERAAYIVGTFDTKARDLLFIKSCLDRQRLRTITVDLATSRRPSPASISPTEVARHHPGGVGSVFTGDRGSAVEGMATAFVHFMAGRRDVGGIISAGGSGGTALVTPAMQSLPVGVPKVMISTVASGNVRQYVGPSDICMIYSVTDVAGINRISAKVLSNAAHALAGMIGFRQGEDRSRLPAIGLTMFGVTTPCVQAVTKALKMRYDCLVFHATGTGGQSMEKLADSGMLEGVIDVTTTEVADCLVGGVMSAGEDRMGAIVRSRIPYVGSCGALDMVNFEAIDTVPQQFRSRNLYQHNPQVTLMRTTPEENRAFGRFIAAKLNLMEGPVRFLLPIKGVSLIDAPGKPFHDPEADRALFDTIESEFQPGPSRRLIKLENNINDPAFAEALVDHFLDIVV
jgi:uncharacterized protein (UPF0261 family)/ABC-type branched-subunit amino acid transport system ATPase component